MKKKEKFNLALWDRLKKDNIPHSFETRDEEEVTQITKFEGNLKYAIIGVKGYTTASWKIDGLYTKTESDSDLFIVWEEEQLMLEGWLYIYPSSGKMIGVILNQPYSLYDTASAIKKVSIPYTKGEGLENGK